MIAMSLRGVRGGVGTSSTVAALGHALHALGQKVLLVDMCPENSLGLHFNMDLTPAKAGHGRPWTSNPGTNMPGWWNQACACCPMGN